MFLLHSYVVQKFQESLCEFEIQQMLDCCTQWNHLNTISCSGFTTKIQEKNNPTPESI